MTDVEAYKSNFQVGMTNPDNKKRNIMIVIIILTLVTILVLIVWVLTILGNNARAGIIKAELDTVYKVMERKKQQNGAYPSSLTEVLVTSDEKIKLSGNTSIDGLSYCIDAKDSANESIAFYINQSMQSGEHQSGTCESNKSESNPTVPGGLSVAYITSSSIKINWRPSVYAKSYVVQCSNDSKFFVNVEIETNETDAICDGLKENTKYYYRVMSVNESGNSEWSSSDFISTLQ